ncbi:MAG: Abi family protein [Firmicutes bacterium]|nr:Abi family protein [Bacillota bacterium]
MEKIFKTLDEQITILRDKNLIIDDEVYVKNILLRENYFFINGYRFPFMKSLRDRTFIEGTNFRELYALFNFDRQLRNILFKNILILENNLKSIISYELSRRYGFTEKKYLNPNNFTKDPKKSRQVNDTIKKVKRQIINNGKQHTATSHYMNNYGYIPLWVVVKVLSFGIVGELYTILKAEDQEDIAKIFNIDVESLLTYLPIIANYRNLCAHEDMCYDHKTQKEIPITKYHKDLNIPKTNGEYIYGINDLFALIIILKRLLREDDFHIMLNEIFYELDYLTGRLHTIDIEKILDKMGFPKNYKDIVRMD